MTQWYTKVRIRHLIEQDDDSPEALQASMSAIADALAASPAFATFDRNLLTRMKNLPEGDEVISREMYANRLLDMMYTYADTMRIWID